MRREKDRKSASEFSRKLSSGETAFCSLRILSLNYEVLLKVERVLWGVVSAPSAPSLCISAILPLPTRALVLHFIVMNVSSMLWCSGQPLLPIFFSH